MKIKIIAFLIIFFSYNSIMVAQTNSTVSVVDSINCMAHDTIVHLVVEKDAKFQGGDILKFRKYVMMNLRYPLEANINKYEGKALVKFVVDWDGKVKNIEIFKSSGFKILDKEAFRVIKNSPEWVSAKNSNICVPQQFILPVEFKALGIIN